MMRSFILLILSSIAFNVSSQGLQDKLNLRQQFALSELQTDRTTNDYISAHYQEFGLDAPEDFVAQKVFDNPNGWTRARYTQSYKGLPVLGTGMVFHEQYGVLKKVSGEYLPLIALNTSPKLSEDTAKELLKQQIIQHVFEEDGNVMDVYEKLKYHNATLVIVDRAYPEFSGDYTLAYEIEASFDSPHYHKSRYIIDANNGEKIQEIDRICHVGVEGVANTRYYGEQVIRTDSLSPNNFQLFDDERNIWTINANQFDGGSPYGYAFFEDEDNYWDNQNSDFDEVAGDAHYCTSKYHDFMEDRYGWDGVDGNGGNLVSVVHIGGKYFLNAFWDGTATYYGNGQCINYGPLTTLDVVGHEFAHGFTEFTSGLIYMNESGALNEAISDIFGKALEYEHDQENFNWYIGKKFINGDVDPFRNMADPNELESPDYYKGEFWITGFFDNGGVHFNSGVYNYWFHMLVEGKAGVNEAGNSYDVAPIGWKKALDIVYGAQVGYFTPSTNYVDAFNYTLSYVEDVWGVDSPEYESVAEAWYAVGLSNDIDQTNIGGSLLIDELAFTLCEGESLEVSLDVVNLGLDTLFPGTVLKMRYLLDNNVEADQDLVIEEPFAPGESILFTFDKVIEHDPFDSQKYLQIMMAVDDSEEYEQIDYDFINFRNGESSDLVLDRVELTPVICSDGSFTLIYYFELESCEFIPVGETIFLTFNVDGEEYVLERPVNFPIRPSITYINITGISFPFDLDEYNEFDVTISHPLDEFPENNTLSSFFLTHEEMAGGDIETFENFSDQYSQYVSVDLGFTSVSDLQQLEDNQWLGFGANSTFLNPTPCPDPEDIYDQFWFYGSSINVCANTFGMSEPVLRFEMTPYYSDLVPDLEPGFSNLTKVQLGGSFPQQDEFPVIHSLDEGGAYPFEYDLPIGSGVVSINSLLFYGFESSLFNGTYEDSDISFFNNVRIEEKSVVNVEDTAVPLAKVFPNPGKEMINFMLLDESEYTIQIMNIQGQLVTKENSLRGQWQWNSDSMSSGIYVYKIQSQDGRISQGKIVLE